MRQLHKLFMSIPEQINILRRRGLICLLGVFVGFWLWLGLSGYYLRCVGVFGWFMKRDLVERSMIHEYSNHANRGKT